MDNIQRRDYYEQLIQSQNESFRKLLGTSELKQTPSSVVEEAKKEERREALIEQREEAYASESPAVEVLDVGAGINDDIVSGQFLPEPTTPELSDPELGYTAGGEEGDEDREASTIVPPPEQPLFDFSTPAPPGIETEPPSPPTSSLATEATDMSPEFPAVEDSLFSSEPTSSFDLPQPTPEAVPSPERPEPQELPQSTEAARVEVEASEPLAAPQAPIRPPEDTTQDATDALDSLSENIDSYVQSQPTPTPGRPEVLNARDIAEAADAPPNRTQQKAQDRGDAIRAIQKQREEAPASQPQIQNTPDPAPAEQAEPQADPEDEPKTPPEPQQDTPSPRETEPSLNKTQQKAKDRGDAIRTIQKDRARQQAAAQARQQPAMQSPRSVPFILGNTRPDPQAGFTQQQPAQQEIGTESSDMGDVAEEAAVMLRDTLFRMTAAILALKAGLDEVNEILDRSFGS